MKTFVSQITDFILAQNKPVHEWVIIVPSQRSVRYIQKSLFEKTEKPLLSPKIITINRFFETVSPRMVLDKTRLLMKLYEIHHSFSTSENKSFDEFYNWGKTLLSDFDEIDRYRIDSKNLFKNLRDIKEIENWSFNSEQLTETQLKFIKFWEELGIYYNEFQKQLFASNSSYMGKALREITENIDWILKKYPAEKFLFAGFNAHSPAELSIIKQLMVLGKADILFDGDEYYMHNGLHEAGAFIRKNLDTLGIPMKLAEFKNNLSQKSLEINVIACAQTTGQVKAAASILEKMPEEHISETLILLAEEDLLVPLLKNIPAKVGKANITLGLSLDNSILKTWIELIFKVQKGLQNKPAAYHKDIFEICFHPFIEEILTEEEKQELILFETNFKKNNLIYASPGSLKLPGKIKSVFELIYTKWENNWLFAIEKIRDINSRIYHYLKKENEYEKALLETFDSGIIDLQNCASEGIPEMGLGTFKNLFTQHYASLTISYFGNPIDGLQIMGLLETRMLDFKRIICIGINEKNMPPNNQINSLIPMDLRSYFGLPTVREKQGIFAHHFYRLLHETEELHLTYSTNMEGMNSSEKSRYIMQLELELTKTNPNIRFNYSDYTIDNNEVLINDTVIEKNEYNLELIKNYLEQGASASALGSYYTCPLDFFYKYILRFGEEIRIEEDIEASTFGSLIHETLETLYEPLANNTLKDKDTILKRFDGEQLKFFRKHADYELTQHFEKHFKSKEAFSSGKNRLNFEMASRLIRNFFDYEKKHLETTEEVIYIEALEQKLTAEIPYISLGNSEETITLRLKGIIDRIDYHTNGYHIIDYKSGKVEYNKLKIKEVSEEALYKACVNYKYFLQYYFYLYLFYKNHGFCPQTVTFVSFVNLKEVESIHNDGQIFEAMVELFPKVMQRIVSDLCNRQEPFIHKEKNGYSYCNFCV
ncbi:MAG: PD-(D/E)XK nuclease family protein [Flavobacteriia bacterium]|nr:PD-(D/E)XK nuclease family protein [Flavobacteriia bacterium]OJX39808.1 MAG: hypothetical protein BGO87_02295 [Flavobacteriia bacterium 40-80]